MPEGLLPSPDNDSLISFDEVIARAKRRGINFGKGDPYNRLRYYTKIGLLPHAKRKSFSGAAPTGAYPESVVEAIVKIDEELKAGKSVQQILREQKDQQQVAAAPKTPLEHLPPDISITPIPVIKAPPEAPKVQAPAFEKGPPYEPFVPKESAAGQVLRKVKPVHYIASVFVLALVSLPLLLLLNTGFRNASKDILVYLKGLNPNEIEQPVASDQLPGNIGEVLGTVTDPFLTINVETDVKGQLNARAGIKTYGKDVDADTGQVFASNIIYEVNPGANVLVSSGQKPTISLTGVVTGTVIRSVSGTSGRISSSGGTNPAIDIASTYSGQTSINTLGTLSTGTWRATTVAITYGGTGRTSGCAANEILKWSGGVWACAADLGGAIGIINVEENGTTYTPVSTLRFNEYDFAVSYANPVASIYVDYTNFGSRATPFNIGDSLAGQPVGSNRAIDIGGNDVDLANTIRIATEATSADTINIGNAHVNTTVAITGGNDWSITAAGAAAFSTLSSGVVISNASGTLSSETQLALSRGGTNANLTAAAGGIVYSTAGALAINTPTATAGQALVSGGAGAPTWFNPTVGSVLFAGTGGILDQDNSNFFWDDTNKRLGVTAGTSLSYALEVGGTIRSGVGGTDGQLRIYSEQGAPDYEIVFQPHDTMTEDTAYTWPAALAAVDDYVLTSDTSGNLAWQSISVAGGVTGTGAAGQATFWTGASTVSGDNAFFWDNTNKFLGIGDSSPTAALTVGAGDVFRVTSGGAIAAATGITSSGTITFSGLTNNGPVYTTAGGVLNSETQLAISRGGTNASSFTNNSAIYYNGTSLTSLGAATDGQLIIGSTGVAPVLATLTGAANEVDITNGAGSITIGLVDPLILGKGGTGAALTAAAGGIVYSTAGALAINTPTATAGQALVSGGAGAPTWFNPTVGSVLFAGTGGILDQDNSNFFWDDTNKRLGVTAGTSLSYALEVGGTIRSGVDGTDGQLRIYSEQGAPDYEIVFQPHDTMTEDTAYTWPAALAAVDDYVLTSDTSGNLAWQSISVAGGVTGTGAAGQATFWTGASTVSGDNAFFWDNTNKFLGIGDSSPTAALTVGAGDVFRVTSGGAIAAATGITSSGTITFSGLTNNGPVYTTAGGVLNSETQLAISRGGTNASSFTNNSAIYYNGTSLTSLGAATDGQLIIGSTGVAPVLATLTGAANEVDITNGAGSITIGLVDPLILGKGGTGAALTAAAGGIVYSTAGALAINTPTATAGQALVSGGAGAPTWFNPTVGSVLFAGTGGILDQDNSNFFWDDTNKRLGVTAGTSLSYALEVGGTIRSGVDGTDGQLRIYSEQGAPDYEIVFQPHDTMTEDTAYTWPAALAAVDDYVLTSDTSGNLAWQSISVAGGVTGTGAAGQATFWTGASTVSGDNAFFWDNTNKFLGIGDSSPTAALTVGAGDVFRVTSGGAIAAATGITSSGTITFSGLTNNGPVYTTAGGVLNSETQLAISRGGTNASSFTNNSAIYYNGTSLTSLGAATDGQLIIGSTGVAPVLATLTGAANEVDITNGAGSITIGLVDPLILGKGGTGAALTAAAGGIVYSTAGALAINTPTATAGQALVSGGAGAPTWFNPTVGSVLFAGTGGILDQDNSNFFWDDTNKRLGVTAGTSLSYALEVGGTIRSGVDGTDGQLRIYSEQGAPDYEIVFQPHDTMTEDTAYTWPAALAAVDDYVLTSDTSGNLAWQSISVAGGVTGTGAAGQATFWTGASTVSGDNAFFWDNTNKFLGIGDSSPTAALTVGAGDVFRVTSGGAIAAATGITSSGTITFSGLTNNGPVYTTAGGVLNSETQLAISRGGTNASSFTNNSAIYYNGTSLTSLGAATDGQLIIGSTGVAPVLATLTGAANEVDITNGAGSITIGLVDPLILGKGGTGAALTASNGGIVYSDNNSMEILAGTDTANRIILSGASSAPSWSTATYPVSTTINQLLYSSAANTITGLATANDGLLVTGATGIPSIGTDIPTAVTIGSAYIYRAGGTDVAISDGGTGTSTTPTDGQLLIGNSSSGYTVANLGAGSNAFSVANGDGSITLDVALHATGPGLEKTSGLSLIRGCTDGYVLKWDDTNGWECAADAAGVTGIIEVQDDSDTELTDITRIVFGAVTDDFNVVENGSYAEVDIDYASSYITRSNVAESISTLWSFENASGITIGEDVGGGSPNVGGYFKMISAGDNAYSTVFQAGTQTDNVTYTLPLAPPAGDGYILASTAAGVMSWAPTGAGGIGTITKVGDVTSGNAFDGTSGQGTSLWFNDSGFTAQLTIDTLAADRIYTMPDLGTDGAFAFLQGTQVFNGAKSFTNSAGILIGEDVAPGSSNTPGKITLVSDGDNAYSTIFQTGTQTQNITYTLPVDDGTADNQVLTTNGSGNLAWETLSGAGGVGKSGTPSAGQAAFWSDANNITGDNNFFWDNTNKFLGIGDSSPTAALTVGAGDVFRVTSGGAIAAATGITSSGTITFSGLTNNGPVYTTAGGVLNSETQLAISRGGTNASSFTNNSAIYYNGTSLTSLGAATDGQLIIGSTGVAPVLATLTGAANEVDITNGAGSITIGLVDPLILGKGGTGAALTAAAGGIVYSTAGALAINTPTATAGQALVSGGAGAPTWFNPTVGSVLFAGTGGILDQDNSNFFWDDTNKRLGVTAGTSLSYALEVGGTIRSGVDGTDGQLRIYSEQGAPDYEIVFQPHDTMTEDTAYTWPAALAAVDDYVLTSDTSGNLAWQSISVAGGVTGTGAAGQATFWTGASTVSGDNAFFWDNTNKFLGIGDSSPTAALTVGAGDVFRVTSGGAIAAATGITSSGTITFSGLTNNGPVYTTAGGVLNSETQLAISRGGTNASSFTNNSAIYYNGTSLTSLGAATDGQLIIGSTGVAPVLATLTGAANEVDITNGAGSITIGLVDPLILGKGGTGAALTAAAGGIVYSTAGALAINTPTATAGQALVSGGAGAPTWFNPTVGSVLFAGTGGILDQDNSNFFWDDTNKRLGVTAGTSLSYALEVGGTIRSGVDGTDGQLRIYSEQGAPDYEIVFQPHDTMTEDTAYTWPAALAAVDDYVLTSDTSGNLAWQSISVAGGVTGTGAAGQATFWTGASTVSGDNAFFWDNTNKFLGIGDSSPTAALTVGAGDVFRVTSGGAIAAATGITSSGTITFSGLTNNGPVYTTAGGVLNSETQLAISRGGTNASSFTNNSAIYYNGTSLTSLGAATDGQLIIGSTGVAPVLATLTGAANEVDITNGAGSITIGLVDPLILGKGGTGAALTAAAGGIVYSTAGALAINTPTATAGQALVSGGAGAPTWFNPTVGSVLFAGTGGILDQDNSNFFWDDTNKRLGVTAGTSLSYALEVGGTIRSGVDGTDGQLRIYSEQGAPDYEIVFQPHDTMTEDTAYTWPAALAAVDDYVLTSDTSGNLAWQSISVAGGVTGTGAAGQATFWTGASTVSGDNAFFWDNTNKFLGIGDSSPTAALTVGAGDVFRVTSGGAIAAATGITSSGTITFSGLTNNGPVYTTAGGVLNSETQLAISRGGTNASSFTNNSAIYYNGTSLTSLGAATDGQLIIGSTGVAPVLATLTGAANEVDITNGAGSITIGLVDPLILGKGGTGAALTAAAGGIVYSTAGALAINTPTATAGQALVSGGAGAPTWFNPTVGSVLFAGTGGILDQDNSNFFWDDTNKRLGVTAGTSLSYALEVGGTIRSGVDGTDGQLRIYSEQGAPDYEIVFQPHDTMTEDTAYTWPAALAAVDDYVLTSDTSGNLAWQSISVAGGVTGTGAAGQATFWTGASTVSGDNAFFWDNTNKFLGIGDSSPTAALTVGAGDVFRVTSGGAIAAATGITSSGTITFSGLTNNGPVYTTAGGVLNSETQLAISRGGTNASSFTNNSAIYYNGTSLTSLGAATDGQLIIGSTGVAPVLATLTGAANEVDITNGAGSITIGLVDPLILGKGGTGAALTAAAGGIVYSTAGALAINTPTATAGQALVSGGAGAPTWFNPTVGSVLFAGTGGILDQDNSNFFWDSGNARLGIGVNSSLTAQLHVKPDDTKVAIQIDPYDSGSGNTGELRFYDLAGSEFTGFKSPDTLSTSGYFYTLPPTGGAANNVLVTDGAGVLTWDTVAGGPGGVTTPGGTPNRIAKFTDTNEIDDSSFLDTGAGGSVTLDAGVDFIIADGDGTFTQTYSGTSGKAFTLNLTGQATNADGIYVDQSVTYDSGTPTYIGNLLDLGRDLEGDGVDLDVTGPVANISDDCSGTGGGSCDNDANVLLLTQGYGSASGAVLAISNAGSGADISLASAGIIEADSGDLTIQTTTSGNIVLNSFGGTIDINDGIIDLSTQATDIELSTGANALTISDGSNEYININTTGSSEAITFGNAALDPTYTFAGDGTFTIDSLTTDGPVYVSSGQLLSETYLDPARGGTGIDTSSDTGVPVIDAGTWSVQSQLALNKGGTNANLTASNGGIVYSGAAALAISSAGTSGQALVSGGAGAPTWFNPTPGSAIFAGTGGILEEDNTNFFWNDTDNRLGIGINSSLTAQLHVKPDDTKVAIQIDPYDSGSGNTGELRFYDLAGSEFTGFKSPDTLSTSGYFYTLPPTGGAANNVLVTDGAGVLTWDTVAGGPGGVTTPGGTPNRIAKFTDTNEIDDSSFLDTGAGGSVTLDAGVDFIIADGDGTFTQTYSGTSGKAFTLNLTGQATNADGIYVDQSVTYDSGTPTYIGNLLDLGRDLEGDGVDLDVTGPVANISDDCSGTGGGSCDNDANVLLLTQSYSSASGAVLNVSNAGTGAGLNLAFTNVGTVNDGLVISNSAGTLTDAIDLTDASGITNAINLGPNKILGTTADIDLSYFDVTGSSGAVAITPSTTGTMLDFALETEWTSGTLINADYASGTTQGGDITGLSLDFNGNLTGVEDHDLTGINVQTPALTSDGTTTTDYKAYNISAAGALDTDPVDNVTNVNWYGLDITMPNIDTGHANDTVTSYGIRITGGTVTNGAGTENAYALVTDANAGNVGIGTTGPDRKLDILDASSPQLRLTQTNETNYADFRVDDDGHMLVTIDGTRFIHNSGPDNAYNFFAGVGAGNTTDAGAGKYNTAVGQGALASLDWNDTTSDTSNTAIGYNALHNTRRVGSYDGHCQVAVGMNAGAANTIGWQNIFIGVNAGNRNTEGDKNIFIGVETGLDTELGNENTVIGTYAGRGPYGEPRPEHNYSGNTLLGFSAGTLLQTGSNNILLGYNAGDEISTGANNIIIGYDIDAPSDTGSNQLSIGNLIFGTGLDAIDKNISSGNIGIQTNAPTGTFDVHPVNATDVTAEDIAFISSAQQITLQDTTTVPTQRQNQFLAPTLVGVAAGGLEQVTEAATVYIDNAPQDGGDITIVDSYALWVDAGTVRIDDLGSADTSTVVCRNSDGELAACDGTTGELTLQGAYEGGNTITTDNDRDISFTLADTVTDSDFIVNLAGGGDFEIQDGDTPFAVFDDSGGVTFTLQGTSDFIVNQAAGVNTQFTASAAPTVDMVNITNTGQPTTTNGVDGLSIDFVTGDGTDPTNNALNIAVTSGGTSSGDVVNGINLSLSGTSGTETAINIGSGWDTDISLGNGETISNSTNTEIALSDGTNTLTIDFDEDTSTAIDFTTNTDIDLTFNPGGTGKVGIGDTSPEHKLDVDGNIGLTAGGYINWGDTDGETGYGFKDSSGEMEFKDSGGAWTGISDSIAGGALWQLSGNVINPATSTHDFAIGGTAFNSSPFGVDESENTIFVGQGLGSNAKITLKASDGDSGTLEYTTSDQLLFAAGNTRSFDITSDLSGGPRGTDVLTISQADAGNDSSQNLLQLTNSDTGSTAAVLAISQAATGTGLEINGSDLNPAIDIINMDAQGKTGIRFPTSSRFYSGGIAIDIQDVWGSGTGLKIDSDSSSLTSSGRFIDIIGDVGAGIGLSLASTTTTTGEIINIDATYAPTDGSTNEAIDINITHTPTTAADNFTGLDLNVTEGANALANTLYGLKVTTDNSANTSTGTHSVYGGYFAATGKLAGTTTTYGLYATASGADTNYALYIPDAGSGTSKTAINIGSGWDNSIRGVGTLSLSSALTTGNAISIGTSAASPITLSNDYTGLNVDLNTNYTPGANDRTGIDIASVTGGGSLETAINIGTGWDRGLHTEGGSPNSAYIQLGSDQTSGYMVQIGTAASNDLTGPLIGLNVNLDANYDATNESITGIEVYLADVTNTESKTQKGFAIYGDDITQNNVGTTTTWKGLEISTPTLTETAGNVVAYGIDLATANTAGAGSVLRAINMGNASGTSTDKTAINIGSGWDNGIFFSGASTNEISSVATVAIDVITGTTGALNLDTGTTGGINIGTNANAKAVAFGNTGVATTFTFNTGAQTTTGAFTLNADSISTGTGAAFSFDGLTTGAGLHLSSTGVSGSGGRVLSIGDAVNAIKFDHSTGTQYGAYMHIDNEPTGANTATGLYINLDDVAAGDYGTTNRGVYVDVDNTRVTTAGKIVYGGDFHATNTDATDGNQYATGLRGVASAAGGAASTAWGVYGDTASSIADKNYGVYGTAPSGSSDDRGVGGAGYYGIYGSSSAGAGTGVFGCGNSSRYAIRGNTSGERTTAGWAGDFQNTAISAEDTINKYGVFILNSGNWTGANSNVYGLRIDSTVSGSPASTNNYGIYLADTTGGTTDYGLYIAGADDWAIYAAADDVAILDDLWVGATTESVSNGSFSLDGDDAYIHNLLGVGDKIYVENDVVIGNTTTYSDGSITTSGTTLDFVTADGSTFNFNDGSTDLVSIKDQADYAYLWLADKDSSGHPANCDPGDIYYNSVEKAFMGCTSDDFWKVIASETAEIGDYVRLAPSTQDTFGTIAGQPGIWLNESGGESPNLIQLEVGGSPRFVVGNTGALTITGGAATVASASNAEKSYFSLTPGTITLTGGTQVDDLMETAVITGATITDASAVTVVKATALSLTAPVEAGSVTLSNSSALRIIDTSGSPTNQYGLYIEDLTAGGSNYPIYQAGGSGNNLFAAESRFSDQVKIGADAAPAAGIELDVAGELLVTSSATDGDVVSIVADSLTTGSALKISGGATTSGKLIELATTWGTSIFTTGYGVYLDTEWSSTGENYGYWVYGDYDPGSTNAQASGYISAFDPDTYSIDCGSVDGGNVVVAGACGFADPGDLTLLLAFGVGVWGATDDEDSIGVMASNTYNGGTQLRLSQSSGVHTDFKVGSSGDLDLALSGKNLTLSGANLTADGDERISADVTFDPSGVGTQYGLKLDVTNSPSAANTAVGSYVGITHSNSQTSTLKGFEASVSHTGVVDSSTSIYGGYFAAEKTGASTSGTLTTRGVFGKATGDANANNFTVGVAGEAVNGDWGYGVHGSASGAGLGNVGVYGSGATYGVWAASIGGTAVEAGTISGVYGLHVTNTGDYGGAKYGAYISVSGAVTADDESFGMDLTNTTTKASGTASKYGLYIASTGSWTGNYNYGLYVATPTGGDNNYGAVFAGGNVGIGDTTPDYTLDVGGTIHASTAVYSYFLDIDNIQLNTSTISATTDLIIDPGGGDVDIDGRLQLDMGTTGGEEAVCKDGAEDATTDVTLQDCTTGVTSDYAEQYAVEEDTTFGHIVALGSEYVYTVNEPTSHRLVTLVKATKDGNKNIIGIISDNYSDFTSTGYNFQAEDNPMPVALNGRVPTFVSLENGPIAVGDAITASSVPGVGMKATESGPMVGKALEAFDGSTGSPCPTDPSYSCGEIMVFVSVGWYVAPGIGDQGSGIGSFTDIDTQTLTAGTINTDVLFVGDRQLTMAPDGKLIVDGGMNILGDVVITGDVDIDGVLGATTVKTELIEIDIPEPDPDTGKSKASIGEATITAGETEVVIETTAVTDKSKVFVTPTSAIDKVLSVGAKVAGESFKVVITSPISEDIKFDWWLVEVASASD